MVTRAAIVDIGSNSLRYMEGVCDEGVVRSYIKLLVTTRLAEGLSHTGRIKRENMLNSIEVLSEFRDRYSKNGLPVYAYATSAVRDAENGCEFIALARSSAGIDIDLLSGKREAEYSYIGATGGRGGLIDIGGGSFQIAAGPDRASYPMGCVRAKDFVHAKTADAGFLTQRKVLELKLKELTAIYASEKVDTWTGVGGSITTIGALSAGLTEYDSSIVNNAVLTKQSVETMIYDLEAMGERREAHPLLAQRHDVILYGAVILAFLIDLLDINSIVVSDRDGMEGYLMALSARAI